MLESQIRGLSCVKFKTYFSVLILRISVPRRLDHSIGTIICSNYLGCRGSQSIVSNHALIYIHAIHVYTLFSIHILTSLLIYYPHHHEILYTGEGPGEETTRGSALITTYYPLITPHYLSLITTYCRYIFQLQLNE